MDQEIRFTHVDGKRVAYATAGDGPALLVPAWWVSHLELEWEEERQRSFFEALAAERTVVRWNLVGTGLSERDAAPGDLTLQAELRTLQAVADRLDGPVELFAVSGAASTALAWAAAEPERVERLTVWGGYAHGDAIASPDVRRSVIDVVRAHWGLGARVLADIFMAGTDGHGREAFARFQREAASADVAAQLLADYYARDVRDVLPRVAAPVTVMHRRDDKAVPYELGVDLAAALPDARLVTLDGVEHAPWEGDVRAALRAMEFAPRAAAPPSPGPSEPGDDHELSAREREVLALVAAGLNDAAIADQLYLSPHTVHRHVANIRAKLRQPSRAAAVAYAARMNLI